MMTFSIIRTMLFGPEVTTFSIIQSIVAFLIALYMVIKLVKFQNRLAQRHRQIMLDELTRYYTLINRNESEIKKRLAYLETKSYREIEEIHRMMKSEEKKYLAGHNKHNQDNNIEENRERSGRREK